ncbi:MAG: hypothetical protein IJ341_10405 [Bacteroidales bacterium]|nr:hypothetical protein [Bacteroidales bacterium]
MSYQIRTIDYRIEHDPTYADLVQARQNYDTAVATMKKWHSDIADSDSSVIDYDKFLEY